jgi:hypothetical protein
MAGDRTTPTGGLTSDPLDRGLFREAALEHYRRLDDGPIASTPSGDGGPARRAKRTAAGLLAACLMLLAAFAWLVRVPVTMAVPAAVVSGADGRDDHVVAVLPAAQAARVRQGVTVRVAVPGRSSLVAVVLRGGGQVLTEAQIAATVPALAGDQGLPARGLLVSGTGPTSLRGRAGRPLLLTAWADLGDQQLIRLAGSAGAGA